jgi:hypothetical protein
MKADPEKAKHWQQHIEAIKSSGLTRRAYCERNGLKTSTLDYWYRRLSPIQKEESEGNNAGWIPLQISGDEISAIDLHVGRIKIAVKPGFDPVLLNELLRALGALC